MINKTLSALALSLLVAACATTQSGGGVASLNVGKGESFNYSTQSTMDVVQSMGGQETRVTMKTEGPATLTVTDRSADRLSWALDMKAMHVTGDVPTLPITDTTVSLPTQYFSTTPLGKIIGIEKPGEGSSQMSQMLSGMTGRQQLATWFSPMLGSDHKQGESWQEVISDTVNNEMMGMQIRRDVTMRYTFDGVVDTLGVKAVRVQVSTSSMAIEGELSIQGFDLAIDGDGAVGGTNYYAQNDGVLLTSTNEVQMNMRIAVPGQGVLPVTQRTAMTIARKK